MATNITYDSSRDLRHTRLVLLSILFLVGLTGCSIVIYWLIRYARWNMRSARICSLVLLSILFLVGLTGCSIVIYWLIRYARWNMRSARICSLILNLVIANLSVYIFATGIQIYWEFQTDRQWPFNDFLCM